MANKRKKPVIKITKSSANMTKEDFELIADVINESRVCFENKDDATINHIAEHFAAVLPRTNRRFDRERFLRSCGVESGYEATDDRGKKTFVPSKTGTLVVRLQAAPALGSLRNPRP